MLRCGAGAPQVESSVVAVAAAAGLDNLEVDITLQSLLIQCTTGSGVPITMLRVVRSSTRDFARLTAVHEFVENLVAGSYDREAAAAQLREIRRAPRFWPKWAVRGALGLLAAAIAVMLGAGPVAALVAGLSALLVGYAARTLGQGRPPGLLPVRDRRVPGDRDRLGRVQPGRGRVAAGLVVRLRVHRGGRDHRAAARSHRRLGLRGRDLRLLGDRGRADVRGLPHDRRDHPRGGDRAAADAGPDECVRPAAGLALDRVDPGAQRPGAAGRGRGVRGRGGRRGVAAQPPDAGPAVRGAVRRRRGRLARACRGSTGSAQLSAAGLAAIVLGCAGPAAGPADGRAGDGAGRARVLRPAPGSGDLPRASTRW